MPSNNQYEIVRYPKLQHVKVSMVEIIFRNIHFHREFELGLVLDGDAKLSVGGKQFHIKKGSLYFANPNEAHGIISSESKSVKIVFIQIANRFCQDYLHLLRNFELLQNDLTGFLSEQQNQELTELFLQTVVDYFADDDLCLLHCMTSLCQLLSVLLKYVPYRRFEEAAYQSRKLKAARMQRITEYIDAHSSEKISLSELAEMEHVTVTHLSHFIHENLNMTFQEYLNSLRLEKAVRLITGTNMPLIDISMESGFSDIKYMNKMFVKRFSCMPKEYSTKHPHDAVPTVEATEEQEFASLQEGLSWLKEFRGQTPLQNS